MVGAGGTATRAKPKARGGTASASRDGRKARDGTASASRDGQKARDGTAPAPRARSGTKKKAVLPAAVKESRFCVGKLREMTAPEDQIAWLSGRFHRAMTAGVGAS